MTGTPEELLGLSARPAALALADGTIYRGRAFGAQTVRSGEVVFNTSITGYQEITTDPSYAGQIVVMTYTQIGNVGVNPTDDESASPFLSGFVVKELFDAPSNFRARGTLDTKLSEAGVPMHRMFVSLERRMHCGMGKCCRCNVGSTFTCIDGPVFDYWSVMNLKEAI